eukprot:3393569-Pyramimonas_sp.AAC.1
MGRGPIENSTEGPSGCDYMRPRMVIQRFVAPLGALPKAPMAVTICVRAREYSASWPHMELHRRLQWL